jgi:hypothetical protein
MPEWAEKSLEPASIVEPTSYAIVYHSDVGIFFDIRVVHQTLDECRILKRQNIAPVDDDLHE